MRADMACILTRITALHVDKLANRLFEPYGLSLAQYKILGYLYAHPSETVTTAELEQYFQMSHSTSVGLLNNLESGEMIKREKNRSSGRSKAIYLTDKAKEMEAELEDVGMQLEREFTANLSEEEKQSYIRLSRKILNISIL